MRYTVIIYSIAAMCAGIEYLRDGERVVRLFRLAGRGVARPPTRWRDLVLSLGRAPSLLLRRRQSNGHAKRFPEEHCARLEDIHANKWASYEPRPVRILASRFIQLDPMIGPVYFPLKRGEFIQGLLASISDNHRVYVVTVPAPAQYADRWPEWPRIISA